MRFVRHSTISEWGLGVVAAEDYANLDIVFEGVGYKKVAKAFAGLVELADGAVPADHRLRKREDWPKVERDGKRAAATRELPRRFDVFVAEFFAIFPGSLRSAECDKVERDYKVNAAAYARKELAAPVLDGLLASGDYREILQRAHRSLSKVNLAFPNELMKFSDIPASAEKDVAEAVVRLVEAGDQTPTALAELADVLAPHGAAKWPIVSLLPFLLDPEHWPFVKPTFIERAEQVTGIEVRIRVASERPHVRAGSRSVQSCGHRAC